MNKEEFIEVLNVALAMYNGEKVKSEDKCAIIVAKLLNRFIVSYDKEGKDFKIEETSTPKPEPIEEIKDANKKVEEEYEEKEMKKEVVKELTKPSELSGGVVEIENKIYKGRITF